MASGNSWQVYQELGNVPSSVFEALKRLPPTRLQRRRGTAEGDSIFGEDAPIKTLVTSPSAFNVGSNCDFGGQEKHGGLTERRRSYSQPRIRDTKAGGVKDTLGRVASFLTIKDTICHKTPSPKVSLNSGGPTMARTAGAWTSAKVIWTSEEDEKEEADDEEKFTTASDFSGCQIECPNNGFQNAAPVDIEFHNVHWSQKVAGSKGRSGKPNYRYGSVRVHDENCPIHGRKQSDLRKRCIEERHLHSVHRHHDQLAGSQSTYRETETHRRSCKRDVPSGQSPMTAALMMKLARRRHKAALHDSERERVKREKSQIQRNLFTLSVAFLFLISAFQGLQNLQTVLHGEGGLGSVALSVVYLGSVISCMFIPPYLLNRIGCKLTLILCMSTFSIYMLTHFSPKWYSLIPGSLLVGLGFAPLWSAKCTYLSEAGFQFAELNLESSNAVIVRFFGIFFMIVHLGQVFGNLISSWILRAAMGIFQEPMDAVDKTCGFYFGAARNLSPEAQANLARPPSNAVYSLCAVYFCCTLVAALIIAMFLSQLRLDSNSQRERPQYKLDVWNTTLQHLRRPRHLLLLPITIFNGMQQAFIAGEFTKAYVGCCLGVTHIGYVMMSFGLFDAVCSLVFGPLIKLFGRMPLLMFGAVVDMLMIFTLVMWPPNPADTVIFYVIAGCWGMADGVWSTQINGLWVVIFADNLAAAFANYRLWESVGFIIAFAFSSFLSTRIKLYVLLAMLYVGMLGYGLIELWEPFEDYANRLKRKLHASSSLKLSSISSRNWRHSAIKQ